MKLPDWMRRRSPATLGRDPIVGLPQTVVVQGSGHSQTTLAATTCTPVMWTPTHRHQKGGIYRLVCFGTNEADRSTVAIYDDPTGVVWVRSALEFNDGRFLLLKDTEDEAKK